MSENSKVILGSGHWVNRRDGRADGWGRADGGMELGQPIRGRSHEKCTFYEKLRIWSIFESFLAISGPSRPQKWIRLEILHRMVPTRGLETPN